MIARKRSFFSPIHKSQAPEGTENMNRRQFAQTITSAALAASTLRTQAAQAPQTGAAPFPLSIMLWTVFNDLPFEQRLAKVAEAGYTNVELVGEYAKWSEADFTKAIAAAKQF